MSTVTNEPDVDRTSTLKAPHPAPPSKGRGRFTHDLEASSPSSKGRGGFTHESTRNETFEANASSQPSGRGFTHESTRNETFEWYTPPAIFDALGLAFDLDPCSPGAGKSFVPAKRHYTIDDDGLTSPWAGTVWVNPPYGAETPKWMYKLAEHGDGIALVFARTDVRWFQDIADQASTICFISGRIKFYRGGMTEQPGTPGAGSMLVAFGTKAADAVRSSGLGLCFTPAQPTNTLRAVA